MRVERHATTKNIRDPSDARSCQSRYTLSFGFERVLEQVTGVQRQQPCLNNLTTWEEIGIVAS